MDIKCKFCGKDIDFIGFTMAREGYEIIDNLRNKEIVPAITLYKVYICENCNIAYFIEIAKRLIREVAEEIIKNDFEGKFANLEKYNLKKIVYISKQKIIKSLEEDDKTKT